MEGGRQRGLAGGEREGRSQRSEVNLMKPDALTSAGSALQTSGGNASDME